MTDEEKIQKRNEMIRDYQEQVKKARYVQDGYFITLDVYKNFLKEHGYILTGYDGGRNIDWDSKHHNFFQFYEGYDKHLNGNMILIGNPEEWGEYMDGSWCNNIVENPFVKYLATDFTKFKIYTIIENERAKGITFGPSDEDLLTIKLEKDLSKEWIQYLVKICPEFAQYLIEVCENNKKEAEEHLQRKKGLIARKYEELKREEAELPKARDQKVKANDAIISVVKEAQENLNSSI